MIDFEGVYESAGATTTKCHRPDGINNRHLIPHSSGDECPRSSCLWPPDSHPLAASGLTTLASLLLMGSHLYGVRVPPTQPHVNTITS